MVTALAVLLVALQAPLGAVAQDVCVAAFESPLQTQNLGAARVS